MQHYVKAINLHIPSPSLSIYTYCYKMNLNNVFLHPLTCTRWCNEYIQKNIIFSFNSIFIIRFHIFLCNIHIVFLLFFNVIPIYTQNIKCILLHIKCIFSYYIIFLTCFCIHLILLLQLRFDLITRKIKQRRQ